MGTRYHGLTDALTSRVVSYSRDSRVERAKGKRRVGHLGCRHTERCCSSVAARALLPSGPEGSLEQPGGLLERRVAALERWVAARGHFGHAAFTSTMTSVQLGSSAASGSANGPG